MNENNQSLEEILFELAVQKPTAAERAAFLDNACRGNPALRAQLDALLEGHFGGAGFLPKPGVRAPQTVTVPMVPAEEAPTQMPRLPGHPARAPEGHHPPRHQAVEHPCHAA